MAETKWTDEQLSAIETRDKTLLVSAAAGSGKTATLTERIIRSLLDEDNPMNIDSLLVVTFTNAAASELRAKISRALSAAVEKNPENKHLKRQLYLLPSAKIRTIDSFCNEILRANCDRVGVPPSYRIADTAETELLAISIIEGMIEATYSGQLPEIASPEEFEELCDCLTDSKRTEDLSGVFRYIYLKCESAEEGIRLLEKFIDNYSDASRPVEENPYGSFLMSRLWQMLDHYVQSYDKYLRIFSCGTPAEQKYIATLASDKDQLISLREAVGYEGVRAIISNVKFVRIASVKSADKTADMESFSLLRKQLKSELEKISGLFTYSTEMWRELFNSLHRLLRVLYRFEARFDEIFTEEKRRIGALSYADIERYTYNCLIKDGEITDIARNVAAQFDAIYIDEYQDVNSLQNRIFEAISRPNNRFMVGDIKQSIYGFRSARPEIFASMKAAFPHISIANGDTASIFMSRNFRCDKAVVDFVNDVFDRAFAFVSGSIGYSSGDRLGYAKMQPGGEPEYKYPKVYMIDSSTDESNDEPSFVAEKILELLNGATLNNGQPPRPSDVAIIMRNAKGKDVEYAAALEKLGIPSCISGAKDFFLSSEVLLALCLLNSIDNPHRDVYLAGLLCSPLFNFSADELYKIRMEDGDTLYNSLQKYVECNVWFTKGADFLRKLNYYRAISEGTSVDKLIYQLYNETGLLSLASRSGGKENLILLYDYARSYEAGSFKGLYNFISFINSIIDKKTTFDDTRAQTGVDAVKIVTSHASKGLEYPIVFMVGSGGKIVNKERNSRLVFSEEMGISFFLRTPNGLGLVENPVRDIINLSIDRKLYEEELRVLYVALTRARERLFVVGECSRTKREEYEAELQMKIDTLSEYSFCELDSYMEIISCCCGKLPLSESFSANSRCEDIAVDGLEEEAALPKNEEMAELLKERFSFKYPSPDMAFLPEKMSVSLMSPTVLDGDDDRVRSSIDDFESVDVVNESFESEESPFEFQSNDEQRAIMPAFAGGAVADESAKRGIATHLFMQFCDLEKLGQNGVIAELKRLTDLGFLSEEDAKRVRVREIESFARSALFEEMRTAKKVHRELRFNLLLPASDFTQIEEKKQAYKNEKILVQGVIDCIVERVDGSLALYDYKTDRLTREEISNRDLGEKKLRDKHSPQLLLYSKAVEKIFGKTPCRVAVYSLVLGDTVLIK